MLNRRALLLAGLGLTGDLLVPYEPKRIYSFPSPTPKKPAWIRLRDPHPPHVLRGTDFAVGGSIAAAILTCNQHLVEFSLISEDQVLDRRTLIKREPVSIADHMKVLRNAGWNFVPSNR